MNDTTPPIDTNLTDFYLDDFGQLAFLKIYTQISSCYSLPDTSSDSVIIETLTKGLSRLAANFPWVAGQVVHEGASEGNPGIAKIKPFESSPRLFIKDYRDDTSVPSMDTLRQARFPLSMLDESILAPIKTLPGSSDLPDGTPVFVVQASFITSGLILTFVGEHSTMDMTGQSHLIHLLSKACRNEPFTTEELSTGNLSRRNLIPLLDDSYTPGDELAYQIIKPPPDDAPTPSPPPQSTWAYFSFASDSLAALKSLSSESITTDYISTDDALSAFIWQSITRIRLPRLTPATITNFERAVDIRRYLNIPSTYPGLIQNMSYNTSTAEKIVTNPLGTIASQLRRDIDPKTSKLRFNTQALATLLNRSTDKSRISFTATANPDTDIMFSSWAKVNLYELDFGLGLGVPEAVRRPRFTPVESLLYMMPRNAQGEIAVAVCLRDEDMEGLRVDKEFGEYATYIG